MAVSKKYINLLKENKNFRFILLAQIVSQLGDGINWMANLAFISIIAQGKGASFLMIAMIIPILIFGPFAGVFVDRFSKKRMLIFTDIARALSITLFLFVVFQFVTLEKEKCSFLLGDSGITKLKQSVESVNEKSNREKSQFFIEKEGENLFVKVKGRSEKENLEVIISSKEEEYEKVNLKKSGEFYIGKIRYKMGSKVEKHNEIVDLKKSKEIELAIIDKNGFYFIIYILTFVISFITQLFVPAKSAIIPEVIKKEELIFANSMATSIGKIVFIVGGAVAGFIVVRYGIITAFVVDIISYVMSALLMIFVNVKKVEMKKEKKSDGNFRKELIMGINYIKRDKFMKFAVTRYSIMMMIRGAGYIDLIDNYKETLEMGVEGLGYIQTIFGVGVAFGAILIGVLNKKIKKLTFIKSGFIMVGVSILIFVLNANIVGMLIGSLLGGVGAAFIIVVSETVIHIVSDKEFRGRVFATLNSVIHALFVLSAILTGYFFEYLNKKLFFTTVGVVLILFGVVGEIENIVRKRKKNGRDIK